MSRSETPRKLAAKRGLCRVQAQIIFEIDAISAPRPRQLYVGVEIAQVGTNIRAKRLFPKANLGYRPITNEVEREQCGEDA